jgi:hypothetical protein
VAANQGATGSARLRHASVAFPKSIIHVHTVSGFPV